MNIGIVRETKSPPDNRVPLSPGQCKKAEETFAGTRIMVQPSHDRCFTDTDYEKEGIVLKENLEACDILMGVKEVNPHDLIPGKTYFFFSHTIKKQNHNKDLLKAVLEKKIRLIDYEILTDRHGRRMIGFGRWAGLVGTYNGMRAFCIKKQLPDILPPQECHTLKTMVTQASSCRLPPIKIAVTGDGRVAGGSAEMLQAFGIVKTGVNDYLHNRHPDKPVYVQLSPGDYHRHRSGRAFELEHFFREPAAYASHFGRFCSKTDMLIAAAYWDPRAPLLITPGQIRGRDFRIRIIADITCDINGSLPSSIRTTTFSDPYYDFSRSSQKEESPFSDPDNITVMTIDNLPCGLPSEASVDFGYTLLQRILPLLDSGDRDDILARATIAQDGRLTESYQYLSEWVNET